MKTIISIVGRQNKLPIVLCVLGLCLITSAWAETVPPLINYQGRLTGADGAGIEGMRKLEFCIWKDVASSASTNLVWGPQTFAAVPLVNGHFNVILGTTDTNGRSIADAFGGTNRYLETTVYDANGLTYATIAPRQQILSAPYAIQAENATYALQAERANIVENGRIDATPIGQVAPAHGRFTVAEAVEGRFDLLHASSNVVIEGSTIRSASDLTIETGDGRTKIKRLLGAGYGSERTLSATAYAWNPSTKAIITQATKDIMVTIYGYLHGGNASGEGWYEVKVDTNSTPTTIIIPRVLLASGQGVNQYQHTSSFLVPKGSYYRIEIQVNWLSGNGQYKQYTASWREIEIGD